MSRNHPEKRRTTKEPEPILSPRAPVPHAPSSHGVFASALALVAVALSAIAAGCGSAPAADAPAMKVESSSPLAEAEADLARAEASLGSFLGPAGARTDASSSAEPGTGVVPSEPTPMNDATPVSTCETACDALGSMRRSAERICSLDESRCDGARSRVESASERVKARCPECES